jgi:hypothetical protein
MSSEHQEFTADVVKLLNTVYTASSKTNFTVFSEELGIRVTVENVAKEEIAQLQELLRPVGTFSQQDTEINYFNSGNRSLRIVMPGEIKAGVDITNESHVHSHDGICLINTDGPLCN